MTTSLLPPAVAVLIGAGPRGVSLLDRLVAQAPALLAGRPLEVHVVDPYPFGAGRIWRSGLPSAWRLGTTEDLSVLADGPSLAGWNSVPLARAAESTSGPHRLGQYLTWAFWRAVRLAPAGVTIRTHRDTAVDVTDRPDGRQRVELAAGAPLTADVVVMTQGRPGTQPDAEQRERAAFADWHGLRYARPNDGDAPDLGMIAAGVDVFVREAGPVTGDQVALLLEGRGGCFLPASGKLTYRPSGAEPRLHLLAPTRPNWTHAALRPDGGRWAGQREALIDAGVAVAHPPAARLELDPVRAAFVLRSSGRQIAGRTLIEPDAGFGPLRTSADPLLRALAGRGELAGWSETGANLDSSGREHRRRLAFGPLTGAFDALAAFSGNDRAATSVLEVLAASPGSRKEHRDPGRLEVRRVGPDDPDVGPMFADLTEEYAGRYGHRHDLYATMDEYAAPGGALLILRENGVAVAGGAFRRRDPETAELKRIWTHSDHRRRGLARRVVAELEREAARRGYRRLFLTTGPRQPEARALYLATGYTAEFDLDADPETIGSLAFTKALPEAAIAAPRRAQASRRRPRLCVAADAAGLSES